MKRFIQLLSIFLSVAPLDLNAQNGVRTVTIDREIEAQFTPERALFVVQTDVGAVVRVPAIAVAAFAREGGPTAKRWLVGASLEVPEGTKYLTSYGIVVGKNREVASLGLGRTELAAIEGNRTDEKLRQSLMEQKGVVSSLKLQLAEQESNLRRLRQDAETIGNFSRVVDAKEELAKLQSAIASVDKDILNLERFAKLANSYPAPKNYRSREQQLSSQLAEIADAAKRAEQGEFARRAKSESDVQQRLRLLEASRTGDIPALQEELSILRIERAKLERAAPGLSAPTDRPATADEL